MKFSYRLEVVFVAKNKTTNNLCSVWEQDRGFDMYISGFGFVIFKDCKRWLEVATDSEGHDMIWEEVNDNG
jgi:hypothetical protein